MAIGGSINQVGQLGPETTPGTAVPCTRRLLGTGIELEYQMDMQDIRPKGYKVSTAHPMNKEWSNGKADGGFAFNEIQYILSSVMNKATPTPQLAGEPFKPSTAYLVGDIVRPITPNGYRYRVTTAGTTAAAEPTWPTVAASTVTSGSVVFTHVGTDVSGASRWQFDMSSTGKDTIQTYTMEQLDSVRNRGTRASYCHFDSLKLSSKRSDKITVSSKIVGRNLAGGITPSVGATEQSIIPGTTSMVNVYLDTSAAMLGTSQLMQNFSFDIDLSDRFKQTWLHNRANPSWQEHVEKEPKLQFTLTVADDTPFDNILTNLKTAQRMFVRFEVKGLEVAPNMGTFYTFQWDVAGQLRDQPDFNDTDGAYTVKLVFDAEHDGTWGRSTRAQLINMNSAL